MLSNQIQQVTIIQSSGLILFHQAFIEQPLDELLFSGLVAALIAFSRELGTELASIRLATTDFYLETDKNKDLIIVIGVTGGASREFIENFMNLLKTNEEFKQLLHRALERDIKVIDPEESRRFRQVIISVLKDLHVSTRSEEDLPHVPPAMNETMRTILTALQEGTKTPKELAEMIFGEGLEKRDPKLIEEKIKILKTLIVSGTVQGSMKSSLQNLITYLERSLRAGKVLGF